MELYLQYRRLRHSVDALDEKQSSNTDLSINNTRVVCFDEVDHNDPKQWSIAWKLYYTAIIWLLVFVTGWASSADSTAHESTAIALHVSEVSESLSTSMYLFGVALGAILAGPCSETLGRQSTYLSTFSLYLIWVTACAVAPNFGSQIVFRGFAGFFSSASMSIYGGSLADMFDVDLRAKVWPIFALAPLLGPNVAPIASGWITQNLGWRWDDWVTLLISGAAFVLAVLFLPETYAPLILSFKASMLRKKTGDEKYTTEDNDSTTLSAKLRSNLQRIIHFIFKEATTVLFGFYLTLLYLLIYGFLEGFDYIFSATYSFDVGQRYSAFAAISIGILLGLPYILAINHFTRVHKATQHHTPEHRLTPALFAAPLLPISLFWIGWTNRLDISPYSSLSACCLFGFALMSLFTSTYHYLLDTYGTVASSALAAITFMRYLCSGGMVLATEPLYEALEVRWTLTLFGCVAAVLTPVPWVFWKYGDKIRARSKYAQKDEGNDS